MKRWHFSIWSAVANNEISNTDAEASTYFYMEDELFFEDMDPLALGT